MKKFCCLSLFSLLMMGSPVQALMRYNEPGWTGDLGFTGYYYSYEEKDFNNHFFNES